MPKDVLLAAIVGAHGLKGEVRVKAFTETPDSLARYSRLHAKDGRTFTLTHAKAAKSGEAIVTFAEVVDRNAAESLRGLELFVPRDRMPRPGENEYYHADLIGLAAMDGADRVIGKVRAIHNFGAGDVIEIERGDGDTLMLPFARDFVPVVDLAARRLVVAQPQEVETGERKHGS
jgi:16S rRNA processing protein RimM